MLVGMTTSAQPADSTTGRVIVGIDGSDNSEHALSWALAKRHRFGDVTPVTVFQPPVTFDVLPRPGHHRDGRTIRSAAAAGLRKVIAGADPALADRATVIEGYPGIGLVTAAEDADLLVVGTRGRSSLVTALLGSVSDYCAKHSPVPVAVIPEDFPAEKPLSTIVVGVDGSGHADAALRWAIDHIEPDGRIIAAGALPIWGYSSSELDPPIELMEKQVRHTVEQSVERVTGADYDGPKISVQVIAEDARVALRDLAATEADLLVVGARGMSGLSYLVLGSVATALVHHPAVPTVLIPHPPVATDEEPG